MFSSQLWGLGMLLSIGTLVALALAGSDSRNGRWKAFFISLVMLAILVNGVLAFVPGLASTSSSWSTTTRAYTYSDIGADTIRSSMNRCVDFYGYFKNERSLRKWDADTVPWNRNQDAFDLFFGLCGYTWVWMVFAISSVLPALMSVFAVTTWLAVIDSSASDTSSYPSKPSVAVSTQKTGTGVELQDRKVEDLAVERGTDGIWKTEKGGQSGSPPVR